MTATTYLGLPGQMRALPSRGQLARTSSRQRQVKQMPTGQSVLIVRPTAASTWTYTMNGLTDVEADLLRAFNDGVFEDGPFVLVDPSVRNVMTVDQSTCGARSFANPSWVVSAGAVTVDANTTPPTAASYSGVLKWTGSATGAKLTTGASDGVTSPDITTMPVYLPGEAATQSLWVKASANVTMSIALQGYSTVGVSTGVTGPSTAFTATTSWQRVSVTGAVGVASLSNAAYVQAALAVTGAAVASVSIAGAQFEYATAPSTWQPGVGAPRVLISSETDITVNAFDNNDRTLVLVQA